MNEIEATTCERLLDKSQEAFLLAIELYNRPTIRYHAEGCCFFLCNAWELMLRAYIIRAMGYEAVYYPGSDRTLSLSDCLKKVFTNENDPLRLNMEVVGEFRNTSTHFVTDEYELFYGPILQECVKLSVYKKGVGLATAMQYVKLVPTADSLYVQGWVVMGIGDIGINEMDLDGVVDAPPKKSLKKVLDKIQAAI